jgi:hypothetical protein
VYTVYQLDGTRWQIRVAKAAARVADLKRCVQAQYGILPDQQLIYLAGSELPLANRIPLRPAAHQQLFLVIGPKVQWQHIRDQAVSSASKRRFIEAAKSGDLECVQAMLGAGYPINIKPEEYEVNYIMLPASNLRRTALYWAARGGSNGGAHETPPFVELTKYLLTACPAVHLHDFICTADTFGHTAVDAAATQGRLQTVRLLVQAEPESPSFRRDPSALEWAVAGGHADCVNYLTGFKWMACECGVKYKFRNQARHCKSTPHLAFVGRDGQPKCDPPP